MPPGLFILALLVASFYSRRYRKTLLTMTAVFYLLSTPFVGRFLIERLEKPYLNQPLLPQQRADAVVVLSGGNHLGTPNLPMSEGAFKRLMYGIMIAKEQNLPLIFSGGSYDYPAAKETIAQLNQSLFLNLIETQKLQRSFSILYEHQSKDTFDNAKYTKALFKEKKKNPTIYLVTSAFHMKRSYMIFKRFGFHILPAATDFKGGGIFYLPYLPSISALRLSYHALHEYIGILTYLIK